MAQCMHVSSIHSCAQTPADMSGQHVKHVQTNFRVTMHSGVFQCLVTRNQTLILYICVYLAQPFDADGSVYTHT